MTPLPSARPSRRTASTVIEATSRAPFASSSTLAMASPALIPVTRAAIWFLALSFMTWLPSGDRLPWPPHASCCARRHPATPPLQACPPAGPPGAAVTPRRSAHVPSGTRPGRSSSWADQSCVRQHVSRWTRWTFARVNLVDGRGAVRAGDQAGAGRTRPRRARPLRGARELLITTAKLGLSVVVATSAKDDEVGLMLDALDASGIGRL